MFVSIAAAAQILGDQRPVVIAHRGASGYLPEHTLAGKAMAHAMGVDYIEQDIVLTKDDQPIVLHDLYLNATTNVVEVFAERARADGRHYAIDFTLREIRQLRINERIDLTTRKATYPQRFPVGRTRFAVATLAEEIELIQGLNRSTGRNVGLYLEPKSPAWHRAQGKDICKIVLDVLAQYGYRERTDRAIVQSFDAAETRWMRETLKTQLTLVQLLGENDWKESAADFDELRTPAGIKRIAEYADGIGPWLPHVVRGRDDAGNPIVTDLVPLAHAQGLFVHPYTFRADALPDYAETFEQLLDIFFNQVKVDGIFTDFPDRAVRFLH